MKKLHPKTNITLTGSRSGLTAYLAGAAGFTAALAAPQADAAVTAVTFDFGPTYTAADGSSNYWTVGSFGYMSGIANNSSVALGIGDPNGAVYHTNSFYAGGAGLPIFFPNGTVIGNSLNGALGYAFWQAEFNPALDFTSNQLNKNIGFKTSTNNWGYANVSWTEATKVLAINSAFVESTVNAPITVGAVPEPGVASLLVLGAVAAARGRRRQRTTA